MRTRCDDEARSGDGIQYNAESVDAMRPSSIEVTSVVQTRGGFVFVEFEKFGLMAAGGGMVLAVKNASKLIICRFEQFLMIKKS